VRHGRLYVDFLQALKAAIEGTYPPGVKLEPPDMSVLDTQTPDVRSPPFPATDSAEPVVPTGNEGRGGERTPERPVTREELVQELAAERLPEPEDDLQIPAFLRREDPNEHH
jgi:hypothetical protein